MEFDEIIRFWYPSVARDVWIDFNTQTVELRPSERRKNSPFSSSSFLPLLSCFLSFSPVCFPSFSIFFSFLFSLSYPPNILSFVCSHLIFSFFFYFYHFLFYFFFFIFYFLFLIWIASTEWAKSGGNFPPLSSIATCRHRHFSLNFLIFLFSLFPSFDTWLNVSHSHKCTTWLMPCVTPLGCHVVST